MKKLVFALLIAAVFTACGAAYNKQLKQVQLGMTKQDIVSMMGEKYVSKGTETFGQNQLETIEYKDRYKNFWLFTFEDGKLVKWWKERE